MRYFPNAFGRPLTAQTITVSCYFMKPTIHDIILHITNDHEELGITIYSGASEEEILNFENIMNCKLPEEIKIFYKFCNGFESEEDMFRIIPLDEILETGKDDYLVNPIDFHIAEYLIYCDMWTLSINPSDSSTYRIYNHGHDVVALTTSFSKFLDTFLKGGVFGGLYDWRERIKKNSN